MRTTPGSPRRRVYETGKTLPEVTTDFRPIPLGFDSTGEPDEQIRAFAVSIRNRADSPIYVREGVEGDGAKVDRFESFDIWENNGVSSVEIRGTNGGEQVEFRILEAHNDFDITDKVDAFVRAISHFLTQNKQETTITETETNFDIGTINDGVDVDSINTDITVGTINDGISVSDGTISVDSIPNVTIDDILGDVAIGSIPNLTVDTINDGISVDSIPNLTIDTINDGIDATIQNSTLTVDSVTGGIDANVAGNVGIVGAGGEALDVDADGNIAIGDIRAANASFDGDITGQTDFDLTAATREGRRSVESADIGPVSIGTFDSQFGSVIPDYYHYDIRENATYDGRIERVEVRLYDDDGTPVEMVGFSLGIDSGNGYERVSPRAAFRGELAFEFSNSTAAVFTPNYYPSGEVVIVWEPTNPVTFSAGDSVGIEIGPYGTTAGTGEIEIEAEIIVNDIVKK